MTSRFRAARTGAAVLGAAVTMMLTAVAPAGADPATGMVDGGVDGYHVNVGKGKLKGILTSLVGFELSDGARLDMYCVQARTPIDRQHEMVEKPWDEFPDAGSPFHANRDRINWILHNSYPVRTPRALTKLLKGSGVKLHGGLDAREAITGTQAAIWHFSDGTTLKRANPTPENRKIDADVVALYDYLTGEANTGIGAQPTPSLEVSPTELSGAAGERIGPFTVSTTGEIDELTADLPDGVKISDGDGGELDRSRIADTTELYLDVPADAPAGEASFELTATAGVDTGRLFVGKNYSKKNKTQSLIVAKSESSKITATARATWTADAPQGSVTPTPSATTETPATTTTTAAPTTTTTEAAPVPQPKNAGGLATTGASILAPVLIGLVLVGAGVGALLFLRRRRT